MGEEASNHSYPGQPAGRNVLSPDVNAREQLGVISAKAMDTVDDEDGLPDHLRDPQHGRTEDLGPVPPDAEPARVSADMFSRDYSPLPSGNIKR